MYVLHHVLVVRDDQVSQGRGLHRAVVSGSFISWKRKFCCSVLRNL